MANGEEDDWITGLTACTQQYKVQLVVGYFWYPWGNDTGLILFNVFNNNLDDGIKHSLSKFVDDTKPWRGGWDAGELLFKGGCWRLLLNLDTLEELADRNLIHSM